MSDGEEPKIMRRFVLRRWTDVTGVSGVGVVCWGIEFPDGSVALRWKGDTPSTVVWDSVENMIKVHGHLGMTTLSWLD